ncbi:MAG: hypothetical protein ABI597_05555 [Gammaproteobacteria bacterium]
MKTGILQSQIISSNVYTHELPQVLDRYPSNVKTLSLDCFDTLLWRTSATPADVFFEAAESAAFKSVGLTSSLRIQAERKARQLRSLKHNISEVTLADIYREHLPSLTEIQLNELAIAEIDAEKKCCYAFPPIVELMRSALNKEMKIIIVSDTYFTEHQLRLLLSHALPEDVLQAIHKIFCSSEHHRSKTNGLFQTVIRTMNEKPENILHIGDNIVADYVTARTLKLNALHFIQDNDYVQTLQRLHSTAANIINPAIRTTRPLSNPFRALFSMPIPTIDSPDFLIGYYSLGPVMYCFADFIKEEVEQVRLSGKNPKILFLMRDGYLPSLACDYLAGEAVGDAVHISRFAAFASSFRTEEDIDRYLAGLGKSNRFHDIVRQLLLPQKVADPIIRTAEKHAHPEEEFIRLIYRTDVQRIIFKKSIEYWGRLKRYLENKISLQPGDTLIFVDLGYSGTTQRQLSPIFKEMDVDIEGRYLIALSTSIKETKRVGLLDAMHFDDKTLLSIVHFISLLEQLCTSNEKSVVDYDQEGNVVYSDVSMNEEQHKKLFCIQNACMQFIHQAKNLFAKMPKLITPQIRREVVLAELSRLLFLPTGPELHYLQSFQFDLNLGTQDVYQLFDLKKGLQGLNRRGLFYIDTNVISKRTHYPAELRVAGFELAVTFMSHMRFNLEAKFEDMLPRKECVEIQTTHQQSTYPGMLLASATHDGYYSVWTKADSAISFCLGRRYQWIQVESAEFIKEEAFLNQREAGNLIDAKEFIHLTEITDHGNGLLQCLSESGMLTLTSNPLQENTAYIFRLVYRPLVFQSVLIPAATSPC